MKFCFAFLLLITSSALAAQEFIDGHIVDHRGDTLQGKLLKHKKRNEELTRKYLEVQFRDSSETVTTYSPRDLKGYYKSEEAFRSINTNSLSVFAKVITDGSVSLLRAQSATLARGCNYFFRKRGEHYYSAIDCRLKVIVEDGTTNESLRQASAFTGIAVFTIMDSEEKYRDFFMTYFRDCAMIVKKLRTGFYTSSDTETMFKEYNAICNGR